MDKQAWPAAVHGVTKMSDMTEQLTLSLSCYNIGFINSYFSLYNNSLSKCIKAYLTLNLLNGIVYRF